MAAWRRAIELSLGDADVEKLRSIAQSVTHPGNLSARRPCRFQSAAEWAYHSGQICLRGRIPITLDSVLPRHMGSGPRAYRDMHGYTSVGGCSIVPVRFNCSPEITLHVLQSST
jgi:hypothetical protein